jgi:hypothetical protein
MLIFLTTLFATLSSIFRSRAVLEFENLALRHQIGVLQRSARKRPKLTSIDLRCAKIPFSFEVDRYNGQPANNRLTFIYALLPEKDSPAIVGLGTAVEMNLVRLELCATVFQVDGNCSV